MSGKATLVINSDTKDGEKAIQHLVKEMHKIREENKKLKEENKKAAEEAREQYKLQREERKKSAEEARRQAKEQEEAHKKHIQRLKEEQKAESEAAEKAKKVKEEDLRLAKEQDQRWMAFHGAIMNTVGAYVSLNTVLQAANQYLERQSQLQRDIAQHSISVGASQLEAVLNMQGVSVEDKQRGLAAAHSINVATGFGDINAINTALASALTASGGNIDLSVEAVQAAAAASGGQAHLLEPYTAATLGVSLRAGENAENALGAVLQAGTLGAVSKPAQQADLYRSVAATGVAMDESGDPAEAARQSMALAAALSSIVGDKTGSATGTATTQMQARLKEFFKDRTDLPTTMDRVAALQADPRLAQQFDAKYNFEAMFDAPITRILKDPDYQGSQILADYNRQLTYSRAGYEAHLDSLGITPEMRALQRENRAKSLQQEFRHAQLSSGSVEEIEKLRQQAYDIASPLSASPSLFFGTVGATPRLLSRLGSEETQAQALIRETEEVRDYFATNPLSGDREREAAEKIDALIEIQKEALAEMRAMRSEQKQPAVQPQGLQEAN